jgi:hypothetical protein
MPVRYASEPVPEDQRGFGEVLEPDQAGKLRKAPDVGADRGLGVSQQPGIGIEAHHLTDLREELQSQRPPITGRIAYPYDPLPRPPGYRRRRSSNSPPGDMTP